VIIVVSESTDGIEVTGSGVVISVLEGIFEGGGGAVTDHGALTGLTDDDHTQYHNDTRGDARYWQLSTDLATQAEVDALTAADVGADAAGTAAAAMVTHEAAVNPHPVYLTQAEGDALYEDAGAAAAAQTAAEATAASALTTHAADTTAVHGIADTSVLETTTGSAAKVAAHEADTTNVHGIANTANLETTTGAQTKVDTHVNDTSAAHAASAISFSPTGTVAATDVQAAIAEVASEAGSGGASTDVVLVAMSAGDVSHDPGTSWAAVNSSTWDLVIPAVAGDTIEVGGNFRYLVGSDVLHVDFFTVVSSALTRSWTTNATLSNSAGGMFIGFSSAVGTASIARRQVVQAGDISGGNVRFRLCGRNNSSGSVATDHVFYASTSAGFGQLFAKNYGQ
jgi:hypothetical protein